VAPKQLQESQGEGQGEHLLIPKKGSKPRIAREIYLLSSTESNVEANAQILTLPLKLRVQRFEGNVLLCNSCGARKSAA